MVQETDVIYYHNEKLEKNLFIDTNNIFVFGSNEAGIHGAGAAKFGVSFGLSGNTFAIPTKDLNIQTLNKDAIDSYLLNN